MKIAIVVNLTKEKAIRCAAQIIADMQAAGAEVLMPPDCAEPFANSVPHAAAVPPRNARRVMPGVSVLAFIDVPPSWTCVTG